MSIIYERERERVRHRRWELHDETEDKKISQNYKPEKQNHTTHQISDQVAKGAPETAEQILV